MEKERGTIKNFWFYFNQTVVYSSKQDESNFNEYFNFLRENVKTSCVEGTGKVAFVGLGDMPC